MSLKLLYIIADYILQTCNYCLFDYPFRLGLLVFHFNKLDLCCFCRLILIFIVIYAHTKNAKLRKPGIYHFIPMSLHPLHHYEYRIRHHLLILTCLPTQLSVATPKSQISHLNIFIFILSKNYSNISATSLFLAAVNSR